MLLKTGVVVNIEGQSRKKKTKRIAKAIVSKMLADQTQSRLKLLMK